MQEEEILEWVIELSESTPDVIESVDRKTLQMLINDVDHLAVFFRKFFIWQLLCLRLLKVKKLHVKTVTKLDKPAN